MLRRRLELEERLKAIRRKEAMDKANYNYNKNNSINNYRVGETRDFKKTVVINQCYSIQFQLLMNNGLEEKLGRRRRR